MTLSGQSPNTPYPRHDHERGEEVFVIEDTYYDKQGEYPAGTWISNHDQSNHVPLTRKEGVLIYVKVGRLPRD